MILAIGFGTSGFFKITDDFSLGGIALGTIVIIAGYHIARAIEPRELQNAKMEISGLKSGAVTQPDEVTRAL